MKKETRNLISEEIDALIPRIEKRDDDTEIITGYAAVFYREGKRGTEFSLWDDYVERILPGAFDSVLKQDVRALFNHDPSQILGRTKNKTLTLSIDDTGLRYEIEPGNTRHGRDTLESVRRGDVTGASFSFGLARNGVELVEDGKRLIRNIKKVSRLYDVGPVTFPAYEAATASARDIEEAQAEIEEYRREQADAAKAATETRRRIYQFSKRRLDI